MGHPENTVHNRMKGEKMNVKKMFDKGGRFTRHNEVIWATVAWAVLLEKPQRERELLKICYEMARHNSLPDERWIERYLGRPLTKPELERIIAIDLSRGHLNAATATAEFVGRKLSRSELERILRVSVNKGCFKKSKKIAKMIGRQLTDRQMAKIIEVITVRHQKDELEWDVLPVEITSVLEAFHPPEPIKTARQAPNPESCDTES